MIVSDENELTEYEAEAVRLARRAQRRAEIMRRRRRKLLIMRILAIAVPAIVIIAVVTILCVRGVQKKSENVDGTEQTVDAENDGQSADEVPAGPVIVETTYVPPISEYVSEDGYGPYAHVYSEDKSAFFEGYETGTSIGASYPSEDDVLSGYAVLVDMSDGKVVVSKQSDVRINPASMTKIMTILVAAEHVVNLKDKVIIDQEITDYVFKHDCSAVNFSLNEEVTVEDVMYGTILPSGADAALALAKHVAGSEEEFVVLMNDKLEELGLSDTAHFTNCTGIYNENHYCTLNDMAMIMKAAVENDLARKILSAHTYTTSVTPEHEEGITISNWFLRRIEDKDTHGEVMCAKTGFVNESGCCAASYQVSNSGGHYICVTADAWSSWRCIYDHVAIYETYVN